MVSRRTVLGAMAAFASTNNFSSAMPSGLAPEVQLWSVREDLELDFSGTLKKLQLIGHREVELFAVPKSRRAFRKQVEDAGLTCVSGHFELMSFGNAEVRAAAGIPN